MRRAWRARIVVANLDNVPRQIEDRQDENAEALTKASAEWLALTEAWHATTRRALRQGLPKWFRWHMPFRNSAVVGWDGRKWSKVKTRTLTLHGARMPFWDLRRGSAVLLEEVGGDRCVWVVAVHVSTGNPRVREAADKAKARAVQVLKDFIRGTGFPVVVAGDWNMTGAFLGHEIYGRQISYSDNRTIDSWVVIDGANGLDLDASRHVPFRLPNSDHRYGQAGYVTAWTRTPR